MYYESMYVGKSVENILLLSIYSYTYILWRVYYRYIYTLFLVPTMWNKICKLYIYCS